MLRILVLNLVPVLLLSSSTVVAADSSAAEQGHAILGTLAGESARAVLNEDVNEAENIFFTDDGRLFVSGAEDIFEFKRESDGSFSKTDYFDEDCVVEGIVQKGRYLYGTCWKNLGQQAFLIAGELTASPVFRIIAPLESGFVPNGMEVDPQDRLYVTDFGKNRIMRMTFTDPLGAPKTEVWATDISFANGIKYRDGFMYVTSLNPSLDADFLRLPLRPDGSAGPREKLYTRVFTLIDDIIPFEDGFVLTDFLKGTLLFWDAKRGVYAETPKQTFYGPTSLAQGRGPMFNERQLLVAEKGMLFIRNEKKGDCLSSYQLP